MVRIFSTRLDEAVLDALDRMSRRLGVSKRQLVEEAILLRVEQDRHETEVDVWSETSGAWRRAEPPEVTVENARREFRRSFERHHGKRR